MAQILVSITVAAAIAAFILSVLSLVANRRHVRKLLAAGVPMPNFHPVFGHFIALKECIQTLPRDTTMHVVVHHLSRRFPNAVFYLNLWPFNKMMLIVANMEGQWDHFRQNKNAKRKTQNIKHKTL
ncbi:hypothetical protein F5Y09DRAFT_322633, partial [Xylaria sp. FL1042]